VLDGVSHADDVEPLVAHLVAYGAGPGHHGDTASLS
jgi:hypothetical protein